MKKSTKISKKKVLGISAASLSLLAGATTAIVLANQSEATNQSALEVNNADNVIVNNTRNGSVLKNAQTFFTIGDIPDYLVENGQYDNIIANLEAYTVEDNATSAAKTELIKIATNLKYYKLWQQMQSTVTDQVLLQAFVDAFAADVSTLDSLDSVIGSEDNIQSLVAQLNGFTTTESGSLTLTGYGDNSTVRGANLVNLLEPASANDTGTTAARGESDVYTGTEYNTVIQVGEIVPATGVDIVLEFSIQTTTSSGSLANTRSGKLIILNSNQEMNTSQTITEYSNNLNVFGRWLDGTVTTNDEQAEIVNNFALSKEPNIWKLFVRLKNNEVITNLKVQSDSISAFNNNGNTFGINTVQLNSTSIIPSTSVDAIQFFKTSAMSTQSTTETNKYSQTVYLGNARGADGNEGYTLPIYTRQEVISETLSANSFAEALDANGNQVSMTMQFDTQNSAQATLGGSIYVNPTTLNYSSVVVSGGGTISDGNVTATGAVYADGAYASINLGWDSQYFAFGKTSEVAGSSTFAYNSTISLSEADYTKKVFFEQPSQSTAISSEITDQQIISAVESQNLNTRAIELIRNVYNNWSLNNANVTNSTLFANSVLRLSEVGATQNASGKYTNINLTATTSNFTGNGNALYNRLNTYNQKISAISTQLTGSAIYEDNVFTVSDTNTATSIVETTIKDQMDTATWNAYLARIVTLLEDDSATTAQIYTMAEQVLGEMVSTVFSRLRTRLTARIDQIYTNTLNDFLGTASVDVTQTFNSDYIEVNTQSVLANGMTTLTNNNANLSLFSVKSGETSLTNSSSNLSGAALAKGYVDLIYKNGFGSTLYYSGSNSTIAAYTSFSANSASLYSSEDLTNNTALASNYLLVYSNLFAVIDKGWDTVLATYLASGDTINISATEGDNSFVAWFKALNSALDSTSSASDTQEVFSIYGTNLTTTHLGAMITGANIFNSLTLRQSVESANGVTGNEADLLSARLAQNLTDLQAIANISLVTGNVDPSDYVNKFNSATTQVALAEQVINDLDLSQDVVFSTAALESALSVTAQRANQAFVGALYAVGIIVALVGVGLISLKKRSVANLLTKTVKGITYGAIGFGVVLVIAAIVATVILL